MSTLAKVDFTQSWEQTPVTCNGRFGRDVAGARRVAGVGRRALRKLRRGGNLLVLCGN